MITLIYFIAILGILVFVHELGHFLVAKKLGVKVEEFAFGFKPRIWAIKKGETTYAINAIPLGGYCTMYGESGPDAIGGKAGKDWERSFPAKPKWARAIILITGVVMNFLLAWLIFTIIFISGFEPLVPGMIDNSLTKVVEPVKIVEVGKNSPAEEVGLQRGDEILSVDGGRVASSLEVVAKIYEKEGNPAKIVFQRSGEKKNLSITPRKNPPKGSGPIGIELTGGKIGAEWYVAPVVALQEIGRMSVLTVEAFGNFIKTLFVKQEVSQNVSGLVGVGFMTDFVKNLGFTYVLQFVALISLSLGVMNLLPVVPLDGGHLFVIALEGISGRKIKEEVVQWVAMGGLVFILLLFMVVTYSDVRRFGILDMITSVFK